MDRLAAIKNKFLKSGKAAAPLPSPAKPAATLDIVLTSSLPTKRKSSEVVEEASASRKRSTLVSLSSASAVPALKAGIPLGRAKAPEPVRASVLTPGPRAESRLQPVAVAVAVAPVPVLPIPAPSAPVPLSEKAARPSAEPQMEAPPGKGEGAEKAIEFFSGWLRENFGEDSVKETSVSSVEDVEATIAELTEFLRQVKQQVA